MAFLDFFRRGKTTKMERAWGRKQESDKRQQQAMSADRQVEDEKKKQVERPLSTAGIKKQGHHMLFLSSPIVSEKSTLLASKNQYVFRVVSHANKIDVKKEITSLYGVVPEAIRIIHMPPRRVRRGRHEGLRAGYKKAIVCLKAGEKIEV